jgi:hypothetical protein
MANEVGRQDDAEGKIVSGVARAGRMTPYAFWLERVCGLLFEGISARSTFYEKAVL